jgi:hypothetical protein
MKTKSNGRFGLDDWTYFRLIKFSGDVDDIGVALDRVDQLDDGCLMQMHGRYKYWLNIDVETEMIELRDSLGNRKSGAMRKEASWKRFYDAVCSIEKQVLSYF